MNSLDNTIANGYKSWNYVPQFYNDYNVKGNDSTCKHETWTDVHGGLSQPTINRYCDNCGYRKLFIKYAKYCKKGGRK